jgi:H+/Cl- antiporter ClcA
MPDYDATGSSTTDALPVAPSMGPALASTSAERRRSNVGPRVLYISALSMGIALAASMVAQVLTRLIGLITNLAFYGRFSADFSSPADNHLGPAVIALPVVGGLIVGVMARFGSKAIRGHGIPEAMEQILFNESRIPARVTFLKPLSAAISIGTGGPFGAEGPIIATGGALGSFVGQVVRVTADERKTLLAAGAAAGMAATFGSPVSAVVLAIELLLFEYRARSIIPVALATTVATGFRGAIVGFTPVFSMPVVTPPSPTALAAYVVLGAAVGIAAVAATRAVYFIEDAFEKLPVHWMWWPAFGAIAVGVVGYFSPATLGVGYDNIDSILSGKIVGIAALVLCAAKFVSWSIALGSGTSGGTLAPLLTVGGALGSSLGVAIALAAPNVGIDVRVAALVGMASMFAGASHAALASVIFAFETTRQPLGLLPLLGGCTAAYLISCLMMSTSIMTEKIARRGNRIKTEYTADLLEQVLVRDFATREVVVLDAGDDVAAARRWLETDPEAGTHQGYPLVEGDGALVGVLTRRDLARAELKGSELLRTLIRRTPVVIYDDSSLREAADAMVHAGVGRLPVVLRQAARTVVGIVTRSDLLGAHKRNLEQARIAEPTIILKHVLRANGRKAAAGK